MRSLTRSPERRSGRVRFAASLGVLACVFVAVTSATITDAAVATFTPVGGTFDVAFANSAGALTPTGAVYAVPDAEIAGAIFPMDSPATATRAHFPLRVVNNSSGTVGAHAQISMQNLAPAGGLDVYSKLEVQVVDPANPGTPLLAWTPTTADPSFGIDLNGTDARTRTLDVQLRLVSATQLDGRYYGVPVSVGFTMIGESS